MRADRNPVDAGLVSAYLCAPMATNRLDGEERRKAIVNVAMPLFARKGFAGTTTKEIAEAAGVSEALVFKHFPSKAALYEEIVRLGCSGDPALERINALEPSTAALIHMTHFYVHHVVIGSLADREEMDTHHRLMVNSYLEDGEYARLVCETCFADAFPQFEACLKAAEEAGDLEPIPIAFRNRFWFGYHMATMLACVRLPGRPAVPYDGDAGNVVGQATWFILRGLGLKEEAIARLFDPAAEPLLQSP